MLPQCPKLLSVSIKIVEQISVSLDFQAALTRNLNSIAEADFQDAYGEWQQYNYVARPKEVCQSILMSFKNILNKL